MQNINLKILKNIRILLLPIFIILWEYFFKIGFIENFFVIYPLTLLYILYCFIVFLLEDIKYVELKNTTNFENIVYSIDNKIIFYSYLLTITISSYYYITTFSLIIVLFLDFIISAREAIENIQLNRYNRLLNYLFYSILLISALIPAIFIVGQVITNIIILLIIILKLITILIK